MEDKVRKEIEDIFTMINRWKIHWLKQTEDQVETDPRFMHIKQDKRHSSDNHEWIFDEFTQLIHGGDYYYRGMVSEAFRRLHEEGYLDDLEYLNVKERLVGEIQDMRRLLRLPDSKESTLEDD